MSWLLLFVPVAIGLEFLAPERHLLIFLASALAIVPLAGWMGRATEQLAVRLGEGVGGLLNATFGNAAELIIAFAALRAGLHTVVKASLVGSIVGNILLVLGAAMLAGGLRHREQHYNVAGARSQATMLTLAAIALVLPAAYRSLAGAAAPEIGPLSVWIALVLLAVYAANLVFSLVTHPSLFAGSHEEGAEAHAAAWSGARAGGVLAAATAAIAWMSEILVGAIEPSAHTLGLNDAFVGVFVVAVLGNAAEHSTAVTAALRNRMDLSLSIAIGSSVQVALFVAPLLVLASLVVGPEPMDLLFTGGMVLTVLLSVLITGQVAGDGRSDWLKGVQLLAVYLVLGLAFFFAPAPAAGAEPDASDGDPAGLDLTVYRDGDTYLAPTLRADAVTFAHGNAWFGESRENAGDHVGWFGELGAVPGIEGALALEGAGTFRARVSGVWTTTQIGLDAAGSNFDDRTPERMTLEDAYLGWSSGDLFPALGEDAVDLSFGSQPYQVGSGFLFWDGGTDGGSRGGYWLGLRQSFEVAAIAKLATGPFTGRAVYLQPNEIDDTDTEVVGFDAEWKFGERGMLGGAYWLFADSDDLRRDGLDVFDLRGEVKPLACLPGLMLSGEVVYQKNGRLNDSWGGYTELGHAFDETFGKPYVSYRYAAFSGDESGASEIEAFDPLFYGMSDWSTWYLGEIFGGWIGANRNLDAHTVRLRAEPAEEWTVNLVGLVFMLDEFATEIQPRLFDPRVVNIRDKDLAEEVDLIVDWSPGDHLAVSAVFAALFPSNGIQQATGGNEVWTQAMLHVSISF